MEKLSRHALKSLRALPEPLLEEVVALPDTAGKILDVIARLHLSKQYIAENILLHPNCEETTRAFLIEKGVTDLTDQVAMDDCSNPDVCDVDEDAEVPLRAKSKKTKKNFSQNISCHSN